jgi:hypothetical protein
LSVVLLLVLLLLPHKPVCACCPSTFVHALFLPRSHRSRATLGTRGSGRITPAPTGSSPRRRSSACVRFVCCIQPDLSLMIACRRDRVLWKRSLLFRGACCRCPDILQSWLRCVFMFWQCTRPVQQSPRYQATATRATALKRCSLESTAASSATQVRGWWHPSRVCPLFSGLLAVLPRTCGADCLVFSKSDDSMIALPHRPTSNSQPILSTRCSEGYVARGSTFCTDAVLSSDQVCARKQFVLHSASMLLCVFSWCLPLRCGLAALCESAVLVFVDVPSQLPEVC